MSRFTTLVAAIAAALVPPVNGQTCELLRVHRNNMQYPNHLNDADALGCFKYANISDSRPFFTNNGNVATVFWEVHHTGANELHFALSEGWVTIPTDVEGDTRGFRGALYRTTGDGIGLHSLTYGYPDQGNARSTAIRRTGQRFYELLMYPNGGVTIRRVSCNSNNVENGGACQRWGGGVSGRFSSTFTYNSNNNPHKFWMTFDRRTGRYQFGSGEDVNSNRILNWVDPQPIPVAYISANVYCCNRNGCLQRANDDNGYFCFCTGTDGNWCRGSASPTTPVPSGSPTTPDPTTSSPTTSAPTANPVTSDPTSTSPTLSPSEFPTTSAPTSTPSGSPTISTPTAGPTRGPTALYELSMPVDLTSEQTERITRMQGIPFREMQRLLLQGGVPVYVAYNTNTLNDMIRLAILYDVDIPTEPPTAAPAEPSGGGGGSGGQSSGSSGNEDSGNSNATVLVVVVVITLVIIAVIVAATFYIKKSQQPGGREQSFDNPMYSDGDAGNDNNSAYMDIQADGNDDSNNDGYMDIPAANDNAPDI